VNLSELREVVNEAKKNGDPNVLLYVPDMERRLRLSVMPRWYELLWEFRGGVTAFTYHVFAYSIRTLLIAFALGFTEGVTQVSIMLAALLVNALYLAIVRPFNDQLETLVELIDTIIQALACAFLLALVVQGSKAELEEGMNVSLLIGTYGLMVKIAFDMYFGFLSMADSFSMIKADLMGVQDEEDYEI